MNSNGTESVSTGKSTGCFTIATRTTTSIAPSSSKKDSATRTMFDFRPPNAQRWKKNRAVLDFREILRGRPLSRPEVRAVRHEVVDRLYKALAWFGTEQADNFRWAMTRTKYSWYSYERLVFVMAISACIPVRLKGLRD